MQRQHPKVILKSFLQDGDNKFVIAEILDDADGLRFLQKSEERD